MFDDKGRNAGDTFQFYVAGLRNPISQSPVEVQVLTFSDVLEVTPEGEYLFSGEIDQGQAYIEAQQSINILPEDSSVTASDSTVQEFAVFTVDFKVSIPIQEGCIVTIQLPEDFKLSAGDLTQVQGWGIFGKRSKLNVSIDESQRTIEILNQCSKYSGPDTLTQIELYTIQNPVVVKTTKSFLIEVTDENKKGIAIIDQSLTFTPKPGNVDNIALSSLGGNNIEKIVDMRLEFTPKHAVIGTSYILIEFPQQVQFSCNFALTMGLKTAPSCQKVDKNVLKLDDPFNEDSYAGEIPLALVFRDRQLPGANLMIQGITIETYATIEAIDYLVDRFEDPMYEFFAPKQQLFLLSEVKSGSDEVYSRTEFTITHTLANSVPYGAIINVRIPPQIEVDDADEVVQNCKAAEPLATTLVCELFDEEDGWHLLKVTDAFPISGLSRSQEIELTIEEGLITPLSMMTSDSFQVVITDIFGHEINYVETALSLTMKQGKDIGTNFVEVSSGMVGDFASHSIAFLSPTPIYEDFLIIVNIPEEFRPPMEQHFICTVSYPLSQVNSGCRINGQRVTVTVAIDESYPLSRIEINESISLDFSLIQNPGSTAPAEPYEIEIKTFYYQTVAVQRTQGAIIANKTPAVITVFDLDPLDLRQLATTTMTLTWINTQVYPKDLTLLIEYDPTEIVPQFDEGETSVDCIFSRTVFVKCEYPPDQPGLIKVTGLLTVEQNPGLQLSLTLANQYINITTPKVTSSWKVTTYTDESTSYSIDTIQGGLSFTFDCNLPCLTCLPDDPDYCTECNFLGEFLILYEGKCSPDCPAGTYKEAYQCIPCDDKCMTCAEKSGSTCTSCYGGYSEFPFLYGNTCVDQCLFGLYGDRYDADCQECIAPCESCSELPTNCTSCIMPPAGQPITKFLHEYECKDKCPDGWVADAPSRSNVCERCSDNCETCFGTIDQCATCKPGLILNTLDLTCVETCPADITVVSQRNGQAICEPCDSKCVTCSGRPDFCTACQDNLNLNDEGVCKLECDESLFTAVAKDGQCVGCSASCLTCQHTQDNCLSCRPGTYFYANSCFEKCPMKDGYQYEPNQDGVCIIPGIICDFGYELIPGGNGCALMAQICIEPNTLNYDGTSCVPGSDNWIPFPMLAFCVLITLIILVAKCKSTETHLVANMIVFLSFVETIGMFVVLYFAYRFGIAPVVYLMLVGIMFNIAVNIFFGVVFWKQCMNDLTFRHWATYNSGTVRVISIFAFIFSFKVYRLLYSKFCGAKRFNAPWDNPYKFYTPLNLASLINLLLVKLICMVGCIFGIYYISWGYQLLIECFEFLIIIVTMLCLSVTEYCQMRSYLMQRKNNEWKQVDKNKVESLRVMGGYEDDLSEDEQDPDQYMKKSGNNLESRKEVKPKALKTIHTLEKLLAQLLLKRRIESKGDHETTAHEVDLLREKQLMLRNRRRCMSFHLERPNAADAWDFDENECDDAERDVISEPEDDKSKEMLRNTLFATRIDALNKVYLMRGEYDNCYAEARDPMVWPLTNAPQETKKLQTNVMELLGVDDLVEDTVTESFVNDAFDPDNQAIGIVNGVINRLDSDMDGKSDGEYDTNTNLVRRGSHPNAEEYATSYSRPPMSKKSTKAKNKRKRLTRKRMAELPNFDVEEILGEFELDEEGKFILLQTADGRLKDKYGRQVNRRGYLIDPTGNIVTRGAVFIFYKEEVDFDDEIPAPYCFQKMHRNPRFTVKNFSVHRRMRKRDKLAMQDEFIEKEYLKLKAQAKQKKFGEAKSQQYSEKGIQGLNQSEKVHFANASSKEQRQFESHLNHMDESSGVGLLQNEQSAQRLGDIDLTNLILSNNAGVYSDEDDGFNADKFVAQNSTNVRRKPPSAKSRKSSKKNDVDDDFINDIIEPVKAKTKEELRGHGSRQSSRSRSRSKSNDKSQTSQRKNRNFVSKHKTLNETSNYDFDKFGRSEKDNSAAEIMAMPTAGAEQLDSEGNDLRNLDFGNQKARLNNSSSAQIKKGARSTVLSGTRSRHSQRGSKNNSRNPSFYENEQRNLEQMKKAVVNDEAFIQKVQKFNQFMDKKKNSYVQAQNQKLQNVQSNAQTMIIDDTFLNPDGSVRQFGLAHKNLNSVYGRVRSKFNKQIRKGGTSLMSRPSDLSLRNRIEEPRRLIQGMTHAQRERMLQLEINNLIEGNQDDMSLTSIQKKLHDVGYWGSSSQVMSTPNMGQDGMDRRRNIDGRLDELRGIYSEYRFENNPRQRGTIASPRSHANLTIDAKNVLKDELKEASYPIAGRRVDQELKMVQEQVQNAQALYEMGQKSRQVAKPPRQKSGRTSASKDRKAPVDLLHGKYL